MHTALTCLFLVFFFGFFFLPGDDRFFGEPRWPPFLPLLTARLLVEWLRLLDLERAEEVLALGGRRDGLLSLSTAPCTDRAMLLLLLLPLPLLALRVAAEAEPVAVDAAAASPALSLSLRKRRLMALGGGVRSAALALLRMSTLDGASTPPPPSDTRLARAPAAMEADVLPRVKEELREDIVVRLAAVQAGGQVLVVLHTHAPQLTPTHTIAVHKLHLTLMVVQWGAMDGWGSGQTVGSSSLANAGSATHILQI